MDPPRIGDPPSGTPQHPTLRPLRCTNLSTSFPDPRCLPNPHKTALTHSVSIVNPVGDQRCPWQSALNPSECGVRGGTCNVGHQRRPPLSSTPVESHGGRRGQLPCLSPGISCWMAGRGRRRPVVEAKYWEDRLSVTSGDGVMPACRSSPQYVVLVIRHPTFRSHESCIYTLRSHLPCIVQELVTRGRLSKSVVVLEKHTKVSKQEAKLGSMKAPSQDVSDPLRARVS